MAKIQRFEDLPVWNNARALCRDIFALMQKPSMKFDFELKSQINRSSASIMDNIAEGFERNNNKEFKHFLYISKSSCGEVRSQLYR
ncbi:MAG: four helix bundle protein, partial [Flavobacteriales bacterium]|nr:four helix bundle protein [Flavobacteriales bacterium]